MFFQRKKKETERLLNSFGKPKDDTFNFDLIERYYSNKDNSDAFQVLSDKTCNDLDFQELFMLLDRTNSKVGEQFLYNKLRVIPSGKENTELDEGIINKFAQDTDFRLDVQRNLEKLNNEDAYYISSLFQGEYQKPPKWFYFVRLLAFTNVLSILLLPFNPQLILVVIFATLINIGIHYWNKRNVHQYLGSIPQLLRLNHIAGMLYKNKTLGAINSELPESIGIINKVRNRMSFFKFEARLDGDADVFFWSVLEFFKILFLLEPLLLFNILKRLDTKRKEIEEVYSFVGQIDVLLSIASLRSGAGNICIPEINENDSRIIAKEVYHPLIIDCVTNDINVSEKSVLLTGSNMSGKTSFIRTMGINFICGLTINTCFARQITLPRMRIYSAIRISDDLMNDKSYYFEEVLTIKEMIQQSQSGKTNLFLLDEIFKGTNTVERISAGKAVLSDLARNRNIVFVSTHDIELTSMLSDEYELYHFSEIVDNLSVDFDYKLKEGKLKNRNAIKILQINNYPEQVIKEAMEISKELDKNTLIIQNEINIGG